MEEVVKDNFEFADSYLKSIASVFESEKRRFDNDLLYNMIAISFEKFMIAALASKDTLATSHLPLMLYRELQAFVPDLSESIRKTAILVGSFEGICSIDDFGYRTPTDEQVRNMIDGLSEVKSMVEGLIEA